MGILEQTPSIRADTEAFNKALKELGLTRTQFNNKLKRLGVSLGDPYSKTNYLNKLLREAGKPELQYKNVISKNRPNLTIKGKVEVGMGGTTPGAAGAPENAKIWKDGAKIQKTAKKKFPNSITKQRKYFVDTMKKIYGKIPKKRILNLFKNTIKGIKSYSPIGIATGVGTGILEEVVSGLGKKEQIPEKNKGGMMDINQMTRPIGMFEGGDPIQERKNMMQQFMNRKEAQRLEDMNTGDPEKLRHSTYGMMNIDEIIKLAINIAQQQGDSSEENIRKIIMQLRETLPSLQQDMADERRSPIASGINTLIDKLGLNRRTNLDRNVSASRTR
tara:strand:+ start:1289 stop:2281 length:993 start_codon:yes stop_codon:yes gene_type:complete